VDSRRVAKRRLPNTWASPVDAERASVRERLVARPKGYKPTGFTGDQALRRRYFDNAQHMTKTLKALRRGGADVHAVLVATGSVFLRDGPSWQQLGPTEAICLAFGLPDSSLLHWGDTLSARKDASDG
jgi:hypothetical protein